MSDKASLTRAELEFSQRIQLQLGGIISPDVLKKWNGCSAEVIKARCIEAFGTFPDLVVEDSQSLFNSFECVTIPETTKRFIVNERIYVIEKNGRKIYAGSNFEKWFGNVAVEPMSGGMLRRGILRRNSLNVPIIIEQGGHQNISVALAWIFSLIDLQPVKRKKGALLTNGQLINVFYVEDEVRFPEDEAIAFVNSEGKKVVLRTVYCFLDYVGWHVLASSILDPYKWNAGIQFFFSVS